MNGNSTEQGTYFNFPSQASESIGGVVAALGFQLLKTSKAMETYKVTLRHDNGVRSLYVGAESAEQAAALVCEAEKAPACAVQSVQVARYNVVKIGRKSSRRTILERRLTRSEAMRVVARYPDSSRSMVVFERAKQ